MKIKKKNLSESDEEREIKENSINKNESNNQKLMNNFDISNIGYQLENEEEILNKLQQDISEYTNYDNIQNPYNFKSWWDIIISKKKENM